MLPVYKKEMRTYFTQMPGYIFLAFFLLLIGIFFTLVNVRGADGNFQHVLSNVIIFFFILMPVLTMRIFSEEARQKTDQLLFTSPLSITGIVLGKFFAALTLFLIGVAVTAVMPFLLRNYGELPVNQIVGTYIGFCLFGMACIAIGVFISVLTENQIIAAVGTMAAIFIMFLIDAIAASMPTTTIASFVFVIFVIFAVTSVFYNSTRKISAAVIVGVIAVVIAGGLYFFNNLIFDGIIVRTLLWFSIYSRFSSFTRGILRVSDIAYYISFAALFIYFTVNVIEKRRWR
ncbi:MAG: ABC transporter permease [Clostridiales bacterium]|jgi:ABC-2 type transport system permease protein|nr:ABC transporter permease [Clostridiales bacterium]